MRAVLAALVLLTALLPSFGAQARTLRVCADPNTLPYSNRKGEGFENRIVDAVAAGEVDVAVVWGP
jgi:mxaJ protein